MVLLKERWRNTLARVCLFLVPATPININGINQHQVTATIGPESAGNPGLPYIATEFFGSNAVTFSRCLGLDIPELLAASYS